MLVEVRDWLATLLTGYTFQYGAWVESAQDAATRYCVVQAAGGPVAVVDVRRPRFRVILLGRRNHREDAEQVMADAEAVVAACQGDSLPCHAARVAAGEPAGPGFTTENRGWASVDIEVIL
ncbi:hypothetical protein [Castellaniella sp.]|uniref:phage tail termination protein n=1 Tax=Castellaniella sp. TaxID=1955812 RepID=UPI002B0009ED|nr:hypothetical protein [Castellaniella sp.]